MGNEDTSGVQHYFIDALRTNKSLLSLNIANNQLDEGLGRDFKDMLEINDTLIDFEISFNSFRLEDVSCKEVLTELMLILGPWDSKTSPEEQQDLWRKPP